MKPAEPAKLLAARTLPVLQTTRVRLRIPSPDDAAATLAFFERNRAHLQPWDPPTPEGFYSLAYWERYGASAQADFLAGTAVRFNLFELHSTALIGRINFTQIARASFQSCVLGYSIDAAQQGKGLMCEALQAAISYVFEQQKLHRIQAAYLPANERSAAVLKRLHFEPIGVSKHYLFINGQWRDHMLCALTNPMFAHDQPRLN
jgi:[ribosomal protein S5]-alanine N-acetyltransferase